MVRTNEKRTKNLVNIICTNVRVVLRLKACPDLEVDWFYFYLRGGANTSFVVIYVEDQNDNISVTDYYLR